METNIYVAAWEKVMQPMELQLLRLEQAMKAIEPDVKLCNISKAGDEEFKLIATVMRDETVIGFVDVILHDGDVHGEEGFSVSMTWEKPDGSLSGTRWAPYVYTGEAFNTDIEVIVDRIQREFDEAAVASCLLRELI